MEPPAEAEASTRCIRTGAGPSSPSASLRNVTSMTISSCASSTMNQQAPAAPGALAANTDAQPSSVPAPSPPSAWKSISTPFTVTLSRTWPSSG